MIRPAPNGPRSLMRTTTARWFLRFVTRTRVPKGNVRCAAVSARMSKPSPLAVGPPWWRGPYHVAIPRSPAGRPPGAGARAPQPTRTSKSTRTLLRTVRADIASSLLERGAPQLEARGSIAELLLHLLAVAGAGHVAEVRLELERVGVLRGWAARQAQVVRRRAGE